MEIKSTSEFSKAAAYELKAKTPESKTANIPEPNLSAVQKSKKLQNLAVIDASINVNNKATNSAADNPMSLLYKTALAEINKQLLPIFGENAAQAAYEENLDVSPQATANRIVQGATAFYDAFKEKNSDLADEAALTEFLTVIGAGIDKGFEEAKDILDSLSVLKGDIASNIGFTYEFVQQGLTDFKTQLLASYTDSMLDAENKPENK
ncbi:MAG: DUF5610 domain-containing protein [Thalassotalea sp.]